MRLRRSNPGKAGYRVERTRQRFHLSSRRRPAPDRRRRTGQDQGPPMWTRGASTCTPTVSPSRRRRCAARRAARWRCCGCLPAKGSMTRSAGAARSCATSRHLPRHSPHPLRPRLRGPAWAPFNTRVRTRPALIAQCADTADVAAAIGFAREAGLPMAVRGGGHHAAGLNDLLVEDGVVIDVGSLRSVSLDAEARTVTVGPGVGWRDIDKVTYVETLLHRRRRPGVRPRRPRRRVPDGEQRRLQPRRRLRVRSGRTYGLGCDHIVAAEVVDAAGDGPAGLRRRAPGAVLGVARVPVARGSGW